MRYYIKAIILFLILTPFGLQAQADGDFCTGMLNVVKVVSTGHDDLFKQVPDTGKYFQPVNIHSIPLGFKLGTIEKLNKRIVIQLTMFNGKENETEFKGRIKDYKNQIKHCLDGWMVDELPNADPNFQAYPDLLFTNSEDETTLRLSVAFVHGEYAVTLKVH